MYTTTIFLAVISAATSQLTYSGLATQTLAQPLLRAAPAYAPAIAAQAAPFIRYSSPAVALPQQAVLRQAPQTVLRASPLAVAQPISVAQPLLRSAPVAVKAVAAEPFDPNPQYNYGYSVSDSLTGDSKTASETRDGGVVKGQYSLVEPDGSVRTVTYTADPINGFNAVVERTPGVAPVVAKAVAAPVAVAQPTLIRAGPVAVARQVVRTPVAYAQPLIRTATPVQYASPAVQYSTSPYAVSAAPVLRTAAPLAPVIAQQAIAQPVLTRASPLVAAAPQAYTRIASSPAVVSTTFGSPLVNYAY